MKIIGIDPGTATIGWGIIEEHGGNLTPVAYGHISTSKNDASADRLCVLADELDAILRLHEPEEASVEELFFSTNVKTAISVAQARGVILLTLRRFGVIISGYTPNQVKQSVTGYGSADKRQVQLMTKNILLLSEIPKPDDVADAIAVAVCHAFSRKANRAFGDR
ncbi:MAG: crossover junction endodeoxyribonuclease RuvC [Candidatus Moranbacteria bacterium]|nr:crossover junction endodeoxyribonuclease RuvC [Candidatus Moranbacteria bacterium]